MVTTKNTSFTTSLQTLKHKRICNRLIKSFNINPFKKGITFKTNKNLQIFSYEAFDDSSNNVYSYQKTMELTYRYIDKNFNSLGFYTTYGNQIFLPKNTIITTTGKVLKNGYVVVKSNNYLFIIDTYSWRKSNITIINK